MNPEDREPATNGLSASDVAMLGRTGEITRVHWAPDEEVPEVDADE